MHKTELERYLHENIPLSKAMQVTVISADAERVVLHAPLEPNINHRETLFGGSAAAIAILAAWSVIHLRLNVAGISCRLVIRSNTMRYDLPVEGAFTVSAFPDPETDWPRFAEMLERYRMARISALARIEYEGKTAGELRGEFVALTREAPVIPGKAS